MNSVKKIKEWLNTFTPFNEQEQVDCQYIRQFLEEEENLLLRDNVKMHFTASAWVLNPSKDKVLMLYHNIYQSWSWSGGHADGEGDLLSVAMKEVKEESGLVSLKPLSDSPLSEQPSDSGLCWLDSPYAPVHLSRCLSLTSPIQYGTRHRCPSSSQCRELQKDPLNWHNSLRTNASYSI